MCPLRHNLNDWLSGQPQTAPRYPANHSHDIFSLRLRCLILTAHCQPSLNSPVADTVLQSRLPYIPVYNFRLHFTTKNAMSASSSVQEAFDFARRDFLQSLEDPHDYNFSQYNSIEQVYDATEKIQKEQEKSGTLRNLNKIQPYLECMSQYAQTIDTFVQVKPEILAIIWVCNIASIFVGPLLMIIRRVLSDFYCK